MAVANAASRRVVSGVAVLFGADQCVEIQQSELDHIRNRVFGKHKLTRSTSPVRYQQPVVKVHHDEKLNHVIINTGFHLAQNPEIMRLAQTELSKQMKLSNYHLTTAADGADALADDTNNDATHQMLTPSTSTTSIADDAVIISATDVSSVASESVALVADDGESRTARHREVSVEEFDQLYASDDEGIDDGDESFDDEIVVCKSTEGPQAQSSMNASIDSAYASPLPLSMMLNLMPSVDHNAGGHVTGERKDYPIDNEDGAQVVTSLRPTPVSSPRSATTPSSFESTISTDVPAVTPSVASNTLSRLRRRHKRAGMVDRLVRFCRYYLLGVQRQSKKKRTMTNGTAATTVTTRVATPIVTSTTNTNTNTRNRTATPPPPTTTTTPSTNGDVIGATSSRVTNDSSNDESAILAEAALGVAMTLITLVLLRRHIPSLFRSLVAALASSPLSGGRTSDVRMTPVPVSPKPPSTIPTSVRVASITPRTPFVATSSSSTPFARRPFTP